MSFNSHTISAHFRERVCFEQLFELDHVKARVSMLPGFSSIPQATA